MQVCSVRSHWRSVLCSVIGIGMESALCGQMGVRRHLAPPVPTSITSTN